MFFSKIWLFLLTLVAAIAVTVALLLPRPAERAHVMEEQQRLAVGCGVVNILLGDNARRRVDFARRFGRAPELVNALATASGVDALDDKRNASTREIGNRLLASAKGEAPDFAMFVDSRGRVVARVRRDEKDFGDMAAGRPLVDDALAGLVRDDLWVMDNTLFLVAAAPVIGRDPLEYVGAVVLGHRVTAELARGFTEWSRGDRDSTRFHVDLAVYLGGELMASTSAVAIDTAPMVQTVSELTDKDVTRDCLLNRPINLRAGKSEYTAVVARMPGEAQARQAYFTVFIQRPAALGLVGSTTAIRRSDLSPASFPWVFVGAGFVVALILGLGLMVWEADRPLRRLVNDAARLARGDIERLGEDHPGRFGSVARNVNIQIDRVARAAKTARQDLDQLLGPAPQGSLGTIDLLAGVAPSGPAISAAPPSEFRFSDAPKPAAAREPAAAWDAPRAAPGMPPAQAAPQAGARPRPPVPRAPRRRPCRCKRRSPCGSTTTSSAPCHLMPPPPRPCR
ncbi:MAG: methyl-accepting chemotaxis protein [Myxococcales bacterium]|nr:methyl-accepting chemotaxis protein [Myxococcales bacterium]